MPNYRTQCKLKIYNKEFLYKGNSFFEINKSIFTHTIFNIGEQIKIDSLDLAPTIKRITHNLTNGQVEMDLSDITINIIKDSIELGSIEQILQILKFHEWEVKEVI